MLYTGMIQMPYFISFEKLLLFFYNHCVYNVVVPPCVDQKLQAQFAHLY